MNVEERIRALFPEITRRLDVRNLIADYQMLIEHIESGLSTTIEEYFDFIDCRSILQRILDCDDIKDLPEIKTLREDVSRLDTRLRPLLLDGAPIGRQDEFWWKRTLPRRARRQFVKDVLDQYGIQLLLID